MDVSTIERSIGRAVDALCSCRTAKMLKVKWNLSHAIGVAMRHFDAWRMQLSNAIWLKTFYDTLIEMLTQSSNYKVRINACHALMTLNMSEKSFIRGNKYFNNNEQQQQQSACIYLRLWTSLMTSFAKIDNNNNNNSNNNSSESNATVNRLDAADEAQHKQTLVTQLCRLFVYLCKYLRADDIGALMEQLRAAQWTGPVGKRQLLRAHLAAYIRGIFEQVEANKLDMQMYNEALTHLNLLGSVQRTANNNNNNNNSSASDAENKECLGLLVSLIHKPSGSSKQQTPAVASADEATAIVESAVGQEQEAYRRKYPFKQTYD